MRDKQGPFEELKLALAEIEAEGASETETDEDRRWTEALRAATAGEAGFGSLTLEEMEAIGESALGLSLDADRMKRTREHLRQKKVTGGTTSGVAARMVPAAIFRREGPPSSEDQQKVQETLERLRRQLDEEDDSQP